MGKIVTIYLSDGEARDLKEFCDENQCTQYSALKTAVRQILSKPIQQDEEHIEEEILDDPQEDTPLYEDVEDETIKEPDEAMNETPPMTSSADSLFRLFLQRARERERNSH